MTAVRAVLRHYIREHGPLALLTEALATLAVFALLGAAFAFPAASDAPPASAHSPRAEEAGRGMGEGR